MTVLRRAREQAKSRRSYGNGGLAERLRSGLQIREDRFDSGTRLQAVLPADRDPHDNPHPFDTCISAGFGLFLMRQSRDGGLVRR